MKKRHLDPSLWYLSSLLLGAGLGCFAALILLPLLPLPLFPGETTMAVICGSACLLASCFCLFLLSKHGWPHVRFLRQGMRANHEDRVIGQSSDPDTDSTTLIACSVCGLPDQMAHLLVCRRCQKLTHEGCCTWVRYAREEKTGLFVDPSCVPCCPSCLQALQTDATSTLTYDTLGFLLVQRSSDAENHG